MVGTAFLDPDGSIGLSLSMGAPGAAPVVLQARLNPATVSGTWNDSAGNTGTFVFTPVAGTPGPARPLPPNGIRPASVTAAQIAPGSITGAQIAPRGHHGSTAGGRKHHGGEAGAGRGAGADRRDVPCWPVPAWRHGGRGHDLRALCVPTVSTTVDDPVNNVGYYTSIAIRADGLPVISHHDYTAGTLRVAKCGNAACTARNVRTTVDDPANAVGFVTSIAIGADGLPVISHQDNTAGPRRVTKCGTQSCS